ncbi:MAG: apolipoprotein N-acyltransferase [Bacteroidales bacterium]|nr:apolipoprotein N-acyltransferase [Bacteroidales bacterium]
MKKENMILWGMVLLFAAMMSVPFLIPHTGLIALLGFIPLLCMERIASMLQKKRIWIYHYSAFVLWNTFTTFWVCNATVGGGIFAILANSLQMSLVFGLFRWSKKKFAGALPYIFLMTAWIAWERFYFDAEISWPWLVLGNAFARTTWAVQWYEATGALGGSLWIWLCNLSIFGVLVSISDGSIFRWNIKAKAAAIAGLALLIASPLIISGIIGNRYQDSMQAEESLEVLIIQPNIDPYSKFQAMTQAQQNGVLLSIAEKELKHRKTDSTAAPLLVLAPETFTNDITCGNYPRSRTWRGFTDFLKNYPGVNLLFGASSYEYIESLVAPSHTARQLGEGLWYESHNSALITDWTSRTEIFHKSKLVVGVEHTPYPRIFCPLDNMLGGVMGRCVGQEEVSLLNVHGSGTRIPVGCAVCYESVYGEYFTDYVRKGAKAMTIITNDAWWGDTPGYRQHLSYASLRAIETRRAIARCANTGISAIISPSGEILQPTPWWEPAAIKGQIPLREDITFYVSHGDITGRVCTFLFILLLLALIVRFRTN